MKYRRIDENGEPCFGQGKQDFLQGIDAVGQAILTRLRLYTNEWWEDLSDGLPVWTDMLGKGGNTNKDRIELFITERILGTKLNNTVLVTGMKDVTSTFDGVTRKFTYTGTAISILGPITISNGS